MALIDDPVSAQLLNIALPYLTDAAASVGTSAMDYMANWWNPANSSTDSTGNDMAIVPYTHRSPPGSVV